MRYARLIQRLLSYAVAALLVFTAVKKIMDYDAHLAHIADVGFLPAALAKHAAYTVIIAELAIAGLLVVPIGRLQRWGWRLLIPLLVVYSYYVYHVLNIATFVPCSCKGVYETLTWSEHYWLNLGLIVLAIGVLLTDYRRFQIVKENIKNDPPVGGSRITNK